jgi:methyltransferase
MLIRVAVCGLMAAARLAELWYSRRNLRRYELVRDTPLNRLVFPLIAALHVLVIAVTLLKGKRRVRKHWLIPLLAVQPLRYWVVLTLGRRWNVRAVLPAEMDVVTTGPYAYVRHPNYSVLLVELAALPASFGLYGPAAVATLANAALLAVRIREEERLLFALPGYAEHFATRPRLIPGVF